MLSKSPFASWIIVCGLALTAGSAKSDAAESHHTVYSRYQCHGMDFNGQSYQGTVSIALKGETYELNWDVASRSNVRSKYQAIGIRVGNTLSAAWAGGSVAGIVVYEINSDGTMSGKWTVFGTTSTRRENLTVASAPASQASAQSRTSQATASTADRRETRKMTASQLFKAGKE